jgi:aryl-alcohol dehydrogenase-like predicted oxidoreductase
LLFSFPS